MTEDKFINFFLFLIEIFIHVTVYALNLPIISQPRAL